MSHVSLIDSDQLVIRTKFGCIRNIVFASGVLVIACIFVPAEVRNGDPLPWYIGLPVGAALLAVGGYRRNISLDLNARMVCIVERIAGIAFRQSKHDLDEFDCVSLASERRRGEKFWYTIYVVSLRGAENVQLFEHYYADRVRGDANRVAEFLGLPFQSQ